MSMEIMEYNTRRSYMVMREYGRHIQKMVNFVLTIEDDEKRQEQAHVLIELMGFLNPHLKNVEDFRHKLWDHLFFISDFKLKVESPYPIPQKETYKAKPEPLPYPKKYPRYSHLGKNLEVLIDKGLQEENPEKRNGYANCVAYYMKLAYNNWHKENVQDDTIRAELSAITKGQLDFTNTPYVRQYRPMDNRDARDNRGNSAAGAGGRSNRGNFRQTSNNRNNRNNNNRDNRDNRGGVGGRDNRNNNFKKKRY
jgi:hypothetical protein